MMQCVIIRAWALLTLGVLATGCDDPEAVLRQLSIKLDPAVSREDRETLAEDIGTIMGYRIDERSGAMFKAAFGTHDSAGVVRYLDERINYVLPGSVRLDSRLSRRSAVPLVDEDFIGLVATNVGMQLWMAQEAMRPVRLGFKLGGEWIPLRSSRVGILRLGRAYRHYEPMTRVQTLVHEARHSDCTGGLSPRDLGRFRASQALADPRCGHEHSICPRGHPYAGQPACDSWPWGAYSIEAVYLRALARACSNCSAEERQVALAAALDSLERVVGVDRRAMMGGRLGAPDMGSRGLLDEATKGALRAFRESRLRSGRAGDTLSVQHY